MSGQPSNEEASEIQPTAKTPSLWARMRQRWWVRWSTDILLIAAVIYGVSWFQARNLPVDAPAPDFTLTDTEGKVHSLSDYRGQRVMLVFWAPWCSVCSVESGNVSTVTEWVADDDEMTVLSVVVGYANMDSVHTFMKDNDVRYPVLLGSRKITDSYGVNAFPTHLIIDEEGRIDSAGVGYTTSVGMWARLWWAG